MENILALMTFNYVLFCHNQGPASIDCDDGVYTARWPYTGATGRIQEASIGGVPTMEQRASKK